MKKVLPFFSYFFHPLFVPLFGVLFYLKFDTYSNDYDQNLFFLIRFSIFTIVIPICFHLMLLFIGKVDSMMMPHINERKIPLLFQFFLFLILILTEVPLDFSPELFYFFLSGLLSTTIAFILLFYKIKASIHLIGMISLTCFVIGLSCHTQINAIYLIMVLLLISACVAASRLVMKAHTPKELFIGCILGAIPQLLLSFFWL